jgi:hypothetical protein
MCINRLPNSFWIKHCAAISLRSKFWCEEYLYIDNCLRAVFPRNQFMWDFYKLARLLFSGFKIFALQAAARTNILPLDSLHSRARWWISWSFKLELNILSAVSNYNHLSLSWNLQLFVCHSSRKRINILKSKLKALMKLKVLKDKF